MSLSRRQKWILTASILLIAVLVGLLALIRYVPVYVETTLLPQWASRAGFDLQAIHIRHVGWGGTDVGPIQLKLGNQPLLEIDTVQIDYSPLSILRKQISGVVLGGVALEMTLNEQGTAIQGLPLRTKAPANAGPPLTLPEIEKWLAFAPGHLAIRHATITLHWRGGTFQIPMTLALANRPAGPGQRHLTAWWIVRDNRLDLSLALNVRANTLDLDLTGNGLRADAFADLLALLGPVTAAGTLELQARSRCALQPFAVNTLNVSALVTQARVGLPGMVLANSEPGGGPQVPIAIQLAAAGENGWHWSAAPLALAGPVRVDVPDLGGIITREDDGWHATVHLQTGLPVQALNGEAPQPWCLSTPLTLLWEAKAHSDAAGAAQFELRTISRDPADNRVVHIRQGAAANIAFTPQAEITGRVDQGGWSGRFQLAAEMLRAATGQVQVHCPRVILAGAAASDPGSGVKARVAFPDLEVIFDQGVARLPKNRIEVDLQQDAASHWSLTGALVSTEGRLVQKSRHLEMRNLSLRLPLQWPAADAPSAGELGVAQIVWESKQVGGLKGQIGIRGQSAWTRLQHRSKLFPGLIVHMEAEAGAWGARATVDIPSYETAGTIDLGRIVAGADGYTAAGRVQARVSLETDGAAIRSEGRMEIDQGVIRQSRNQLVVEGIACDLKLVDLMTLRSAPRQQLRVAAMTVGNLSAKALQVDFQLEPETTLFIERADLQWCLGKVQAQALRLKPDLGDLDVTLYCDRLNLAMLLSQLGAARGSGDGEVNGRIPISWHAGHLSFDNGFLYSTPGQTGTIQLEGTEILLDGLPPGSPQRIQLDIATEALRDYSYNWAKLKIDSQQDILLLRLQLDGKPNQLLPFAYDPQSGNFLRIEGKGEAEFKGISIDLNFRTPLQEILHYRELAAPVKK